jgi:glutamate dehydrogenase
MAERRARGQGLTSPELAVLLAYGKMWLSDVLVESDLPEDLWIGTALQRYFPARLREQFGAWIPRHPLRREIVVTHVVNSMVNRVGPTFVHRLGEISGASPEATVRGYLATREIFGLVATWQQIEALDNQVGAAIQADMVLALGELIAPATSWLLRSGRLSEPMEQVVERFTPAVSALRFRLEQQANHPERAGAWIDAGVPAALARHAASAAALVAALDIAEMADATKRPLEPTAQVHAAVGERLGLDRLRRQIAVLPADSYWQGLARVALADDLGELQRAITEQALRGEPGPADQVLARWEQENRAPLQRAQKLLAELSELSGADLAALSVALRELRNLL